MLILHYVPPFHFQLMCIILMKGNPSWASQKVEWLRLTLRLTCWEDELEIAA